LIADRKYGVQFLRVSVQQTKDYIIYVIQSPGALSLW